MEFQDHERVTESLRDQSVCLPSATDVYTVGYQGHDLHSFGELLKTSRITRVVDVRELPLSRRRGFSKTPLREALAKVGIEYVHLRVAGNPYRDQKGDIQACLNMYRMHITSNPDIAESVRAALIGERAALMCVETDTKCCHRSILVQQLLSRWQGFNIINI
jgi:uncharacterized protein (DUF488 family)